jgi:diacylglycerol kinase family enzyme
MRLADQNETARQDDCLPAEARRVLICVNLRAGGGRGEKATALALALRDLGLEPTVLTELDEFQRQANDQIAAGSVRAVVAAGGDGTVAEVFNRVPAGTALAVLPLGTANLLAKFAGLRLRVEQLAAAIATGNCRRLDAGTANGRLFTLMAGVGFDAEVVARLHEHRRGPVSYWSYGKPILAAIRSYSYPPLRIYCDGVPAPFPAAWAFVVNAPAYAAGLNTARGADAADGRLDVTMFRRGGLCRGLTYAAATWGGIHRRLGDFAERQAVKVRIEADQPARYQLDGDPGGLLPVDIEVLPGRLRLVVPVSGT